MILTLCTWNYRQTPQVKDCPLRLSPFRCQLHVEGCHLCSFQPFTLTNQAPTLPTRSLISLLGQLTELRETYIYRHITRTPQIIQMASWIKRYMGQGLWMGTRASLPSLDTSHTTLHVCSNLEVFPTSSFCILVEASLNSHRLVQSLAFDQLPLALSPSQK